MKPHEFLLLALVCAVLDISNPSPLYSITAHLLALLGSFSSFKQWQKESDA